MQKHTINLTDKEFQLFHLIRGADEINKRKDDLIEIFIKQIELFSKITADKPKKKWLQTGNKSFFKSVSPVKPKKNSPLASDIILEQRKHLTVEYE